MQKLSQTVQKAYETKPDIKIEVFIHKVLTEAVGSKNAACLPRDVLVLCNMHVHKCRLMVSPTRPRWTLSVRSAGTGLTIVSKAD